jgi:Mrp family chromosome partitioning ATPase
MQVVAHEESKLVDRIFLADPPEKIVAFTSPERDSGCSWMVARIAQRLAARTPDTVCAVDGNLHWPALHRFFGIPNESGLLEAAAQQRPLKEFAQQIAQSNLWVVPSGGNVGRYDGPPAIEDIRAKLEELARSFDYILVDTPSIGASSGSVAPAFPGKSVILVIAANSTKRDAALRAKMTLESAEIPILGAVLNRRKFPIPDRIFQYL